MIQVENLTFTYPGQDKPVLNNISLTIEKGTFMAIIGSNGSGKSTMCKLFNGIIPHFFVGDIKGRVMVNGIDTFTSDVSSLSEKVGYVYQDFENSIVRSTVLEEVSFAPLNYGFDDYRERAKRALNILKIDHLENEYIWQLSGGQKHLVALASVVAIDPDYIIVDEPVAQLDPFHAKQTYNMLKLLHEKYDKTIIVIEHHTEFIADYCKEVLLMKDGQVKWKKSTQEALTEINELIECKILPPQVTQVAYGHQDKTSSTLPININQAKVFFKDFKIMEPSFTEENIENSLDSPTVNIENMTATYKDYNRNQKIILKDINLRFYKDERIAIVGNNGAGKSTLMRLMSKLMKSTSGKIEIMGESISEKTPEEIANIVSYIYQNPEEMFIDDSIDRDVSYFLKSRKIEGYKEKVNQILDILNLSNIRDKDARLLSGGQQRRVSLAIGMGMTPKIILLDEPTGSLDIASRKELLNLLDALKLHIQTAIVATHDMQLVADWATRVIVLNKGEVIYDNIPRKLFESKEIMEKANLIPPQIIDLCHCLDISPPCLSVAELEERFKIECLDENGGTI